MWGWNYIFIIKWKPVPNSQDLIWRCLWRLVWSLWYSLTVTKHINDTMPKAVVLSRNHYRHPCEMWNVQKKEESPRRRVRKLRQLASGSKTCEVLPSFWPLCHGWWPLGTVSCGRVMWWWQWELVKLAAPWGTGTEGGGKLRASAGTSFPTNELVPFVFLLCSGKLDPTCILHKESKLNKRISDV